MTSKHSRPRVLVIEDEVTIAEQIKFFLEDAGMLVAGPFGTLAKARDAAMSAEFDVAVVDINLGGEDSYPVVDQLAKRGIPFILTTGYAPEEMPAKYAAYPSLTKPFEPQALLDAIEGLTRRG